MRRSEGGQEQRRGEATRVEEDTRSQKWRKERKREDGSGDSKRECENQGLEGRKKERWEESEVRKRREGKKAGEEGRREEDRRKDEGKLVKYQLDWQC